MYSDPLQRVDTCDTSTLSSPMQTSGTASYHANTRVLFVLAHIFHIVIPLIEGISSMQDGGVQHVGDILSQKDLTAGWISGNLPQEYDA